MAPDILLVFGILTVTVVLFVTDRFPLDFVAMAAVLALLLTKVLTPREALAGFSDPIVVIIAGLFVVGAGLFETGVAEALGQWMGRVAGSNPIRLMLFIMVVIAVLSSFMSSTGATATLLPTVVFLARGAGLAPSRLLIPLAYGSLVGGMLTLIGTPPNIVVSRELEARGHDPFGFFAFAPMGLIVLAVALVYMALAARRLLPDRETAAAGTEPSLPVDELVGPYRSGEASPRAYELVVGEDSPLAGATPASTRIRSEYGVSVIGQEVEGARSIHTVEPDTPLHAGAILSVVGRETDVARFEREQRLARRPVDAKHTEEVGSDIVLAEVLLTPRSRLVGRTLQESRFRSAYKCTVLGITRVGKAVSGDLSATPLRFGDTLLVSGTPERIGLLRAERRNFVVVAQAQSPHAVQLDRRAWSAVAVMVGMLVLMTLKVVPAVTATLAAAGAMVAFGCVRARRVYRTINWQSLVVIAAMLPMATALQKTGGLGLLVDAITTHLGGFGPRIMMVGLFVGTAVLSQFISNTAVAVLMAPIAYEAATSMGVSSHPFLMAVAVAASAAFSTPVASPVNTLVLGAGGYRFMDYVRAGLPLQVIVMVVTTVVLPLLFPF